MSGITLNHSRAVRDKHHHFLGMLLVGREIIATTNPSTIFKTHVFSLYSDLFVYVSTRYSGSFAALSRRPDRSPARPTQSCDL